MSKPMVSVSQNSANNYISAEMNKDLIKQIPSVASHAIFSIESNWKLVNFVFKHSSSSRRLVSSFRSFDSSKNTKLKANMKIGDKFELQKIIISKADRTHLVIKRNDILGASSFDFTLLADGPASSGGGSSASLENVFFTSPLGADMFTINGNAVSKASGPTNNPGVYHSSIKSQQSFVGDGYIEWTNNQSTGTAGYYIVSLSKDPRPSDITGFEFILNKGTNQYEPWINNVNMSQGNSPGINIGDVLRIEKSGKFINMYKNSVLIYTYDMQVVDNSPYYMEVSFYDVGATISNAKIYGQLQGSAPAVASPLFTTASGYTDYYGLTDKRTNTLWSGYVGLSVSTRANVYISPFPAGLTEGSTYKVRFYISQITTPSNDFSLAVAGYGPEVVMSGVDALASYTSKGYVEFNYQIGTSVWGLYIRSSADNQGLCSFTVSKVEIYAI